MKIGLACGGTGGHIFPGLATAQVLGERGHEVSLWLTDRDTERLSVHGWDGPVHYIGAEGFPSTPGLRWFRVAGRLLSAIYRCRREMKADRPDVMLAMGSYASIGPGAAARLLRVPLVLHEANAVPGRAVSLLSGVAAAVAVTFDTAVKGIRCKRIVRTGLPIRPDLEERFSDSELDPDLFTILVMGGSQGSHRLNVYSTAALCRLQREVGGIQVIHLAGAADEQEVRRMYRRAGVPGLVHAFMRNIGAAYDAADIALCRAGAATCTELSMCGLPALLVPLPWARRDHQTANARALEALGAVDVRAESDLTSEWLRNYIEECMNNRDRLAGMSKALRSHAVKDAAVKLANLVEETATGRSVA